MLAVGLECTHACVCVCVCMRVCVCLCVIVTLCDRHGAVIFFVKLMERDKREKDRKYKAGEK